MAGVISLRSQPQTRPALFDEKLSPQFLCVREQSSGSQFIHHPELHRNPRCGQPTGAYEARRWNLLFNKSWLAYAATKIACPCTRNFRNRRTRQAYACNGVLPTKRFGVRLTRSRCHARGKNSQGGYFSRVALPPYDGPTVSTIPGATRPPPESCYSLIRG